ncbi:MAG: lipase maturation factor family protein [Hyphomicrobium sp.]|uniref:lipase maturation factor family protein n=1 Tax=Hyphomicrobium sp. TaxID=82 RepID=UPI0025B81770|nr:lipase maturation factor family protein [Hyphomicrobium sp.]MBZ0210672.1 lipase maturation factor family protein [Hyphomicrobium sp.]
MRPSRPTFVYDGDCGICRTWVDYWRRLTGDAVVYRPYQDAAGDLPEIPIEDFKHAVQLIEPDGQVPSGAAATFRLLSYAPARGAWWWVYRTVPGFAPLSEWAYSFLSRRRGLLAGLTRTLWGRTLEPERYALVSWLFLRGLGFIYLAAFVSLALQIRGLVGEAGILPLGEYLDAAREGWGQIAYWRLPTLFWLHQSDAALITGAIAGIGFALLLTFGFLQRTALVALFVLYLSFIYAGQLFLSFQWDMLLVEVGFLAIFLTGGSRIVIWLYRFLLFRFLFLAGLVKLASGDPTWRQLTALDYHFFTQPLPSPLAWYAAQLPHWLLATGTAAALIIELFAVVLIFMPRRPRMLAAALVILFQLGIVLTGSYNWFNLLTMLLCLFLFDDQALRPLMGERFAAAVEALAPRPGRPATALASLAAIIVVPAGLNLVYAPLAGRNLPVAGAMTEALAPLLIVNPYGLFATTTTTRPVIVFEGSSDNRTWREYALPYLPGPVARAPAWNIPYQPRLDWQLWFAAYGSAGQHRWIERLLQRLLEGSPHVLALFSEDHLAGEPPKYVRAQLYDYRFSDARSHDTARQWWERRPIGTYYPSVSLPDVQRAADPSSAGGVISPASPAPALP